MTEQTTPASDEKTTETQANLQSQDGASANPGDAPKAESVESSVDPEIKEDESDPLVDLRARVAALEAMFAKPKSDVTLSLDADLIEQIQILLQGFAETVDARFKAIEAKIKHWV